MEGISMDVYLLYAETQLHAGRGAELGIVDLPIQRERTTKFPIIQGIKGALRAYYRSNNKSKIEDIFGSEPESDKEDLKPGEIAISEAKILLFPVRNPDKLFVWVTCPLVLARFLNAVNNTKDTEIDTFKTIENLVLNEDEAIVLLNANEVWLEEIALNVKKNVAKDKIDRLKKLFEEISKSAPIKNLQEKLKKDVVIVNDVLFSKIVETMTEVIPRVRIENGVVKEGALWYEEYLPQDTIMYFVARPSNYGSPTVLNDLESGINGKIINIGGKETVGKGMVWVKKWGDNQ